MSAVDALRIAHAAGVTVALDGESLFLEADVEPPRAVLDALSSHKVAIIGLLTPFDQPCLTRSGHTEERPDGFLHFCIE